MKRTLVVNVLFALLFCSFGLAQQGTAAHNPQLEKVLNQMDATAKTFKSAQADFTWDQYTQVVNDHDLQSGTIYFRRESKGIEMAADITKPGSKYVLFKGSSVQVYQPGVDQVTKYDVGKNRGAVESFLVLGFGGGGHELLKSFNVSYGGEQSVDGVSTEKLELVPKSAALRNNFNRIVLWIDPARGISVQQQAFSSNGDYRLAKYSNIKLNQRIPDGVFKLKTTSNTTYVSPSA